MKASLAKTLSNVVYVLDINLRIGPLKNDERLIQRKGRKFKRKRIVNSSQTLIDYPLKFFSSETVWLDSNLQ